MQGAPPKAEARFRRLDVGFAVFSVLFVAYAVLVWQGILGPDDAYRPGQLAGFATVLAVQSIGGLFTHQHPKLARLLFAASACGLVLLFRAL